jgi:histidinol-phosphatase (PHP family)
MIANYHTHTPRCGHATGTEDAYVRCALEAGLQLLGFSDHTPYPFPQGHHSHFRMRVAALCEYAETVGALRKAYAGQIEMHLGVEAEYYPKFFPELVSILKDHGVEYMLLGQHFLYNEVEGIGSIGPYSDEKMLHQYCNQVIEAMHTGLFTYFAHPDLIHFIGDEKIFRHHMRDICREANSCGMPLEFNLLGLAGGRHYPTRAFWELAAEEGCVCVLGRDAHSPEALLDEKTEKKALEILASLGIQPVERTELKAFR